MVRWYDGLTICYNDTMINGVFCRACLRYHSQKASQLALPFEFEFNFEGFEFEFEVKHPT